MQKKTSILGFTFFVWLAMTLLGSIALNFEFLDPLKNAIADFDVTDLVFSRFRSESMQLADTSIVLVNIGEISSRKLISEVVTRIAASQPKAIGVDIFFRNAKIPLEDSLLAINLQSVENLVLVTELQDPIEDSRQFGRVATSHPMFCGRSRHGFVNLVATGEAPFKTVRYFSPKENVGDTAEYSFASMIAQIADSSAFKDLMKREKEIEIINYRGNTEKFLTLDWEDVLAASFDTGLPADKVVLLGFMGANRQGHSLEDVFYTPLNKQFAGKAFPDMYGIVVHANILSMILARSYIYEAPEMLRLAITFLIWIINAMILFWIDEKTPLWFILFSKIFVLIESIAILTLYVLLFSISAFKVDLTVPLVGIVLSPELLLVYKTTVENIRSKLKFVDKKIK